MRKIVAQRDAEDAEAPADGQIMLQEQVALVNELFYTEGLQELRHARAEIAQYSLQRAARRLAAVKRRREDAEVDAVSLSSYA